MAVAYLFRDVALIFPFTLLPRHLLHVESNPVLYYGAASATATARGYGFFSMLANSPLGLLRSCAGDPNSTIWPCFNTKILS